MPLNKLLIIVMIMLFSLLSACGFQLRGYSEHDAPKGFSSIKLDCPTTHAWQLCQTLRQKLMLNNISFDDNAKYRLAISPIEQESRTLSLQSNASTAEYGLSSKVSYQLVLQESEEVLVEQEIVVRNSYRHQSSALLSKERERSELQSELSQRIASEIFRQIDVVNKQTLTTSDSGSNEGSE